MGEAPSLAEQYFKYTTVTGYFKQDDPDTDPKGFDYTATNFGLIDRVYDTDAEFDPEDAKTQWQRFEYYVSKINEKSPPDVQYKVLYMGRHGEGFHNVAEAYYGSEAWDCYYSLQDGDELLKWSDALLTQTGITQAQKAAKFWSSQLLVEKTPPPESYYASPLLRCLETANATFSTLNLPEDRPFIPMIKELFREVIGVHTCDRRSKMSEIVQKFPDWRFEKDFTEDDELWSSTLRETAGAQDQRMKIALDDVFWNDRRTWISISSHSGAIGSILRVLGHREFSLGTGQVIPVLVKAEKVVGKLPEVKKEPWEAVKTCSAAPYPIPTS